VVGLILSGLAGLFVKGVLMITEKLDLSFIAARLEGLEETIITRLIDRAQFSANGSIYKKGHSGFKGENQLSLFTIRLTQQEQMDARFGRFCVPEERPFTKDLPVPQRVVSLPDIGLKIINCNVISQANEILSSYLDLIPKICSNEDDGQYGSSVEHDIYAIQAIARRIHYGSLYVAESKFLSAPDEYNRLIKERNTEILLDKLTRKEVEDKIIIRIRDKTASVQACVNKLVRKVIDPEQVANYYRDWIIPLTKKGEIAYLFNRLNA
jgi:chorismate mutase